MSPSMFRDCMNKRYEFIKNEIFEKLDHKNGIKISFQDIEKSFPSQMFDGCIIVKDPDDNELSRYIIFMEDMPFRMDQIVENLKSLGVFILS